MIMTIDEAKEELKEWIQETGDLASSLPYVYYKYGAETVGLDDDFLDANTLEAIAIYIRHAQQAPH